MTDKRTSKWYINKYWKESFNWNKDGSVNLKSTAVDWLLTVWFVHILLVIGIFGFTYWIIHEALFTNLYMLGMPISFLVLNILIYTYFIVKTTTSINTFMFSYKKQYNYEVEQYDKYLAEIDRLCPSE